MVIAGRSDVALPLLLLFLLSCTQPAVSGGSDRDEESGRGQRHPTLPPPVPHLGLLRHRVAAAETKLQAESGEIRCVCVSV